jgi:manganese/zinc/iron transport system ATP- binding protein
VSYVPQKEAVDWDFPITVEEVVMMGRYSSVGLFRKPSAEDRDAVSAAIEKVGIIALRKRNIKALSGGQQQRVFIARALAQQAQFYFMDEPFAGVDKATEETIINLLKTLADEHVTCLVVHHDLPTVTRYFDTAILLNTSLVACGPAKEVMTDENLKATFGGRLNILSSVISNIETEGLPTRHTT